MKIERVPDIDLSKVPTPAEIYRAQREKEIHEEFQRRLAYSTEKLIDPDYWRD